MKKTLGTALLALALFASGCGGSASDQEEVADLIIQAAKDAGATPDEGCIRDKLDGLSDADAKAMVDAGLQGDPSISDGANDILVDVLTC